MLGCGLESAGNAATKACLGALGGLLTHGVHAPLSLGLVLGLALGGNALGELLVVPPTLQLLVAKQAL